VSTDVVGRVEVRGIDRIPEGERHGRPRELFWIWFGANIAYLYFTLGGFVILLGLTIWQSIAVLIVGNLYWAFVGFLAISGPVSGTPSTVVTRAMFGIIGNRPLSAGLGWIIAVAYEFINLAIGALAGFALAERLGWGSSLPLKVVILLVIAAVTFAVSVYGHATITKISPYVSGALAAAMAVLGVFIFGHANFAYAPHSPLHGAPLWAMMFLGIAIIAAIPLSWGTGADYARYLPASVSKRKVIVWTALGGFVPSLSLGVLGVIAGTRIDMTDAQSSLKAILPDWFYPVLLAVILVSSMTSNILTAYSSGLCLQALGLTISRARSVFLDGVISTALAAYVLFVSNFLDSISSVLELSIIPLAPAMGIYVTDIILRRNRYDGHALHVENSSGIHWYRHGWNLGGAVALAAGMAACLLTANTSVYEGPLAVALGGADISVVLGPVVSAIVYLAFWPMTRADERGKAQAELAQGEPVSAAA
jgi:NCS1 family nucleobase:cation symporter-1